MSDNKSSFHPALAVSNIKNHVPIMLEMENVQYSTWAELFKIHARSHKVLNHIIPPKASQRTIPSTDAEKELWSTLDATVLSWIYSTISNDLLHTIIEPDSTAMEAWDRLRDIFQDNQHSRVVALEQDFTTVSMERLCLLSTSQVPCGSIEERWRTGVGQSSGFTIEAGMSKEAATESAMVVTSNDDGPITSEKSGRFKGKQGVQHSGGRRNNGGRKNNNSGGGGRYSGSGKGGGRGQNSGGQSGSSSFPQQQQHQPYP
ncbi:uncharacterized protein LOC132644667 [Lycium barbarum]|uniref:uncharacterized protein LOC132644667 n=1 Tax=Lycium barbarum TaxID=112863 RepID=UPI00293E4582|nr:uncharacterized protein LOC132644667 [Lycium barbarum]